ncbi:MAG TPA: FAD-dependent oxidoreductase [Dongiaceae bacterium]|nr:FAD-dependent oxidoreductase [Dongiaceae bacterium]
MADTSFDCVIVGGGVFGLAGALELARRGRKVAVIDRLGSGHPATSSTGASRSIRIAYDQPLYVKLAMEAIRSWRKLEAETGRRILHLTGQIDLGPEKKLRSIQDTARGLGGKIEMCDAAELRRLMPELAPRAGEVGLFHPDGGTVMAEQGMLALAEAAKSKGVAIFAPERATKIDLSTTPVTIVTDKQRLRAARVVLSAGPWSGALLADLGIHVPLAPAVAQVTFLDAPGQVDRPGVAEWETFETGGVYGHPVPGIGYKIALDAGSAGWDPDVTEWTPDPEEERRILDWLAERIPGMPRKVQRTQRHPWTMTPDADFIVDNRGPLTLACGCSGHAFKFGPALGRLVADVMDGVDAPAELKLDRPAMKRTVSPTDPIVR